MCGRYNLTPDAEAFIEVFGILEGMETLPDKPRYNIAPGGDPVPAIRRGESSRALCALRWPLIPHWAKEDKLEFATANAKGETVKGKASFRDAWRKGRFCLIPANGYYEWRKTGERKQPYHVRMPDGGLFAFGGLWDRCRTAAGEVIESCTIITTPPTTALAPIHNRMPLIIPRRVYESWLAGEEPERLIRPYDDNELDFYPVSTFVNNPRNDDARCVEPVEAPSV